MTGSELPDYQPPKHQPPKYQAGVRGWGKPRVVFLAISAALCLLLVWWASEVLLPFLLAGVVAYVLTPAVAACERRKVPRPVAILVVYGAVLTTGYLGVAAVAPRIYREAVNLSQEAPNMARQLATEWGPRIESKLNSILGRHEAPEPPRGEQAAAKISQGDDGSYSIRLGSGFDIVQDGPKRWHVTTHEELSNAFSISQLFSDGIDESFKYAQRNVMEVIRVGHAVLSHIAHGLFLSFMVLMVAGYLMHTRERVVGFFRSLVPPAAAADFDLLMSRIDKGLAGVVRGQMVICLLNGMLSAIGFALLGLKYWP
ncbi:MAG TPA: AI-2E family transporter, partial [Polyangiaceae bacterium]|nr:AI-2E family transporter [Polyangiaceae bacterium]